MEADATDLCAGHARERTNDKLDVRGNCRHGRVLLEEFVRGQTLYSTKSIDNLVYATEGRSRAQNSTSIELESRWPSKQSQLDDQHMADLDEFGEERPTPRNATQAPADVLRHWAGGRGRPEAPAPPGKGGATLRGAEEVPVLPSAEWLDSRHNGSMELDGATQELYREAPAHFTAARDRRAAEARQAGHPELASSLKKLRKPSVGAWLANLLVLEHSSDVQHLVDLGVELRAPTHKLEGDQIRRVSKEKADAVSKLIRKARSAASRVGQSVSAAAAQELEATLEAAFADPHAAESLLEGRLSSGLHYSGLGFDEQAAPDSTTGTKGSVSPGQAGSDAGRITAMRNLGKAQHEAEQADSDAEKARHAVAEATKELARLKSAEALAVRRSKAAQARVSAARKRLDKLR